jgi:hypothetical protein
MEENCPTYTSPSHPILLDEKCGSCSPILRPRASLVFFPIDPPPYSLKPNRLKRSESSYRRKSSQRVRPDKTVSESRGLCPACLLRYLRSVLRAWVETQRKPYTAITVQIDRLTSEQYEENDIGGIVDLIEVIRIQESGPTEAARAIRKKLSVYACYTVGMSLMAS